MALCKIVAGSGGGSGIDLLNPSTSWYGDTTDSSVTTHNVTTTSKPRYVLWTISLDSAYGAFYNYFVDIENQTVKRCAITSGPQYRILEEKTWEYIGFTNISDTGFTWKTMITGQTTHNIMLIWY